jgi:hypothetical protein
MRFFGMHTKVVIKMKSCCCSDCLESHETVIIRLELKEKEQCDATQHQAGDAAEQDDEDELCGESRGAIAANRTELGREIGALKANKTIFSAS